VRFRARRRVSRDARVRSRAPCRASVQEAPGQNVPFF